MRILQCITRKKDQSEYFNKGTSCGSLAIYFREAISFDPWFINACGF